MGCILPLHTWTSYFQQFYWWEEGRWCLATHHTVQFGKIQSKLAARGIVFSTPGSFTLWSNYALPIYVKLSNVFSVSLRLDFGACAFPCVGNKSNNKMQIVYREKVSHSLCTPSTKKSLQQASDDIHPWFDYPMLPSIDAYLFGLDNAWQPGGWDMW